MSSASVSAVFYYELKKGGGDGTEKSFFWPTASFACNKEKESLCVVLNSHWLLA